MNLLSFNCPCGNDNPRETTYHHGFLGYESFTCHRCGAIHDHTGIHYPELKTVKK